MAGSILGLFVKYPAAGQVKTRLAASLGAGEATAIYEAFVTDLVTAYRTTAERRVLCISPADIVSRQYFSKLAAECYAIWPQPDADLGARLNCFFEEHLNSPEDRAVIIGSDSPTLPYDFVTRAFELLREHDCVVGPAVDGGFYLIGQRERPQIDFRGIAWSTSRVLEQAAERFAAAGKRLGVLPPWYDVDTLDDWHMLCGHVRAALAGGERLAGPALSLRLALDFAAAGG